MHERGFTLIEVLVAIAILGAAALVTGRFLAATTNAMAQARAQTSTAALALARMEQLRALDWIFDSAGAPQTDVSTDLSTNPPSAGGSGLLPSPSTALVENTPRFVDYLDDRGEWIGSGGEPPPGAMFVRRWSVDLPADGAADTLVFQVLVRRVVDDVGAARAARGARGESRFVTVRTRTSR
jgi:prepilin-type N-terminal cleavage/methylation domain-containing protein